LILLMGRVIYLTHFRWFLCSLDAALISDCIEAVVRPYLV